MKKELLGKILITRLFLFFIFIALSVSNTIADETPSPVSVTTQITPENFTLGDIATYTIKVQHDPTIVPSAPAIKPPEGLEFIESGESPPQNLNGQTLHQYWYKLRIDEVGPLKLPAVLIEFDAPDPNDSMKTIQGTILAPEASMEVQSLLNVSGTPEGVRDIKPLEEISPPWIHYLWMALAGLTLIALLYFFWRKWKSRPTNEAILNLPSLSPEELAFKELEALKNKGWLQIGRIQDHFFELSEIFRRYLQNRYHFPAREWTTEEITAHFKNFSKLSESQKLQARSILTQSDRVKFAKAEMNIERDEMQSVIDFIKEAQPTEPVTTSQVVSAS